MWLVSSLNWRPSLLMSFSVYSEGTSVRPRVGRGSVWLVSSLNWRSSLLMSLSVYSEGTSDCKDVSGP